MTNLLVFALVNFQEEPLKVTGDVGSGLIYVIAAYAVVWLFIFGYLFSLTRRQANLRREIEALKQAQAQAEHSPLAQAEENRPASISARQLGG